MKLNRIYIVLLVSLVCLIPLSSCSHPRTNTPDLIPSALIADQLRETMLNAAFINDVSATLTDYGLERVDVEYGEGLDLRFFIDLPAKEYSVVVLRVHSGILGEGEEQAEGSWLFTNEPCQTGFKYTDQRLTRKVAAASIDEEHQPVFAIGSRFVTETMQGTFPGTVVIAMGCRSFIDNDLAEAFIAKGASLYIGWSGLVTLDYTDEITQVLVDKLFRQGMIVQEAIDTTLAEIGTQASHEATLRYYPSESGGKSITDLLRKN